MRDPHGGVEVLHKLPRGALRSIRVILGDAAYVGPFDDYAKVYYGIDVERTKRYAEAGTTLKPKRWIVERTFAWLNHFRRSVRDYEKRTVHSESTVFLSMIQILIRRLGKITTFLFISDFSNTLRRGHSASLVISNS